jgi:hypothetical protein
MLPTPPIHTTQYSCASSNFCAAITDGDIAVIAQKHQDGSITLRSSVLAGADGGQAHLTAISCPVNGFCKATGDWDVYTYSHGRWSQGVFIQDQGWFQSIFCASKTACVAYTNSGWEYRV